MSTRQSYKDGQFCWIELASNNTEKSKAFYKAFLDWSFEDNKMSEGMIYTNAKYQGQSVCGLFTMDEQMKSSGIPPYWNQYISTSNIEKTCEKVKAAGGSVINGPFDAFTFGRMAICQDSTGANFSLWQSKEHFGAEIVNEANTWGWNELVSWERDKSQKFYSEVFGWEFKSEGDDKTYFVIHNGSEMNGGLIDAKAAKMDEHIPGQWGVYFTVSNIQEALKALKNHGGEVMFEPMEAKGTGTFAAVKEPEGAYFSIIELEDPSLAE